MSIRSSRIRIIGSSSWKNGWRYARIGSCRRGRRGCAAALGVAPAAKKYRATVYPQDDNVSDTLATLILDLETILGFRIWSFILGGNEDEINDELYYGLLEHKTDIVPKERVGLTAGDFARDIGTRLERGRIKLRR